LIPQCIVTAIEAISSQSLVKESRVRSQVVATQATSTFPSISKTDLVKLQSADVHISRLSYYWSSKHPPTIRQLMKEEKPARKLLREWKRIEEEEHLLYRVIQLRGQTVKQLILPESLKNDVLTSLHDDLGHQGVEKTIALIRNRCYWPGMVRQM